jgi:hypothetical protein
VSRVAKLNRAIDAGAQAAWELEPELAALYLKAIRAQCAIAVRKLTALGEGDRDAGAPVTADGHASWTKPDPDELGLQLREQMDARWETGDPETIRVEAMRRVTEDGLAIFGVSFSVKNPAVRGVLGQLGRKIVGITATTREEIMRAIDGAWEQGLSIPHTAELIRDYSANIAPARATTIARTELIGAVNGGSHAVASVGHAWGAANGEPPLLKIWLTAEDERVRDSHVQAGDDYAAGLGIPLDDPFSVGDDELMFPGDPDGSAGEVINCRCAISYEEAEVPGGGVSDVSPDASAIDDLPDATTASATTRGGSMQDSTWNGRAIVATGAYTAGGVPVFELAEAPSVIDGAKVLGLPDARDWTAVLCIEGIPTGDGRFLAVDSIGWRELPLTLMALISSDHGGGASPVAIIAGRIDEIERMPAAAAQSAGLLPDRDGGYPADAVAVIGRGVFDASFQGDEVMRLIGDKTLRGISIDLATEADEVVELEPAAGEEFGDLLYVVTAGKIMGATVCPFAAFAEATIMLEPLEAPAEAGTPEATPTDDAIAAALGGPRGMRVYVHAPIVLKRRVVTAAARDYSSSSMIAVHPTPEQSAAIGVQGGQPDHHVTLAFLPDTSGVDFAALNALVAKVAADHPVLEGCVGGAGYFGATTQDGKPPEKPADAAGDAEPDATTAAGPPAPVADAETDADSEGEQGPAQPGDGAEPMHPHVAMVDAPGLGKMRAALCNALDDAGIGYAQNHDFTPHVTLAYEPTPNVPAVHLAGQPLSFSHVIVHEGLNRTAHPLAGAESDGPGITASAAGLAPMHPPTAWFEDPELAELTPLTITDEGRIYGHLAPWGACHVGVTDTCVQPPPSSSGYALFHLGDVLTEEGDLVPCGTLTLDTGHADLKLGSTAARMHYDHTGTAAADVRCGEDDHGIWFSGAIRPDLDAANVRKLRAARELVAALSVNVPGFPIVRPRAAVAASGRVLALVAAGIDMRPSPADARRRTLELAELARPGYLASRRAQLGELARR